MLYTKCIFKPKDATDGRRISVMSRHTLNDGKTPDLRITSKTYDEWMRELAPLPSLVGDYYNRGLPWIEFERNYIEFLGHISLLVSNLAQRAVEKDLTLLCVEETTEHCHRRLLAEECQRYFPSLKIEHR